MAETHDPNTPPDDHWDQQFADALIGKTVLVGLTRMTKDEQVIGQEQFYGFVVEADRSHGIRLELDGSRTGDEYVLPPQTSALQPARRGEYRLRETGEVVVDPDYLATWIVNPPDNA